MPIAMGNSPGHYFTTQKAISKTQMDICSYMWVSCAIRNWVLKMAVVDKIV